MGYKLSRKKVIYLIGSLRNNKVPVISERLRKLGFEVFDDWYAAGPEADDYWKKYEKQRGHTYGEGLKNWHTEHVWAFDHKHLDRCDIAILYLPAGKSGHLELGYAIGKGKKSFILYDKQP